MQIYLGPCGYCILISFFISYLLFQNKTSLLNIDIRQWAYSCFFLLQINFRVRLALDVDVCRRQHVGLRFPALTFRIILLQTLLDK